MWMSAGRSFNFLPFRKDALSKGDIHLGRGAFSDNYGIEIKTQNQKLT